MSLVKMLKQGQLKVPASFRKELKLEEETVLTLVKVGSSMLLTPKRLQGDALAVKVGSKLSKNKFSLEDVLENLQKERRRYNKKIHGF